MRHVGSDHHTGFSLPLPRGGVIYGFKKAEFSFKSFRGKSLKILAGGLGRNHQCECRGVWRNNQILSESAF